MRKAGWVLVGVFLGLVILGQAFLAGLRYEKLEFLRVVDGDTFWVVNRRDGSEWKVRLWGVDAPDAKECYFKEAGDVLEKELAGGRLSFEKYGRDDYGRILAKVYVNGINVEELLVATGAAVAYDAKEVHDELRPNTEYVQMLKKIEDGARVKKLGLWSEKCP